MPLYTEALVAQLTAAVQWNGGGTVYMVKATNGSLYAIYVDSNADIAFRKSNDNGLSWGNPTVISGAITATVLAVWYDRWSGISGDLIHVCWSESAADDISYRNINTASSDALSAITVAFAGVSTAAGGALSITRARGGDLIIAGSIDAGAEDGAWRSTDVGATWAAAIADPSEAVTQDQYLLLPGWNADTADIQLIFWDASADELSVKRWDASANTWNETSIATSMVDQAAATAFPHVAAAVDFDNSRNVVVAWSAVDLLNADLRCWIITDTTITEVTNVVQNSTDDQGLCAITIDRSTGYWYVFYGGKSDGSETYGTSLNVYMKVSTDAGTTWGPETRITDATWTRNIRMITSAMWHNYPMPVAFVNDQTIDELLCAAPHDTGIASMQVGI